MRENCDCGSTGGCQKCNPQAFQYVPTKESREEYYPFLEPFDVGIKYDKIKEIAKRLEDDTNYIFREDYLIDIVLLVCKELQYEVIHKKIKEE